MTLPKRTIEEWLTVARIVRSQRIVFVEGKSDAAALFLASGLPEYTDFRTADEIEHDPATTAFVGGNKKRVCDLLLELREFNHGKPIEDRVENLKGLVDRDYECIAGEQHVQVDDFLYATQFANLFAGAVTFETVREPVYAGHGLLISEGVWTAAIEALRFCFAARYHNAREQLERSAPNAADYVVRREDGIGFEVLPYLQAYFGVQGVPREQLMMTVANYYDPELDIRNYVHSKDFFGLIYGVVRLLRGGGGGLTESNVRSTLLAAMSVPACNQDGVAELVQWASAA
jgi:hypothetical protein